MPKRAPGSVHFEAPVNSAARVDIISSAVYEARVFDGFQKKVTVTVQTVFHTSLIIRGWKGVEDERTN
jgi:hypothetical protein